MPIFEYVCKECGKKFEAIVYGSQKAECPACKSKELEQQYSSFAARSTGGSGVAACGAPSSSCGTGGG